MEALPARRGAGFTPPRAPVYAPAREEYRMLHSSQVPVGESALLVVDAQDSFKVAPRWERRSNRAFESNVQTLIDAYRRAGPPATFFLPPPTDGGLPPPTPPLPP